jgi:hypothetical protein
MSGQRLGLLSLRLDAIYCLILGLVVALSAPLWASSVALPMPLLISSGIAVVLWAGLVEGMRAKLPLRTALRIVMLANIAATVAVAAVSVAGAALIAVLSILSVAVDIALFAGSQALALNRLRAA